MSQMANVLVKDDSATPVEFTLKPVTDTPFPLYRANVANVPIEAQVRLSYLSEKLKSGVYKLSMKLEVPVQETLGASGTSAGYVAPPKVAYTVAGIFTMYAPARSTSQDRANVLKMLIGVAQGASATPPTYLGQGSAGGAFVASTYQGPAFFTALDMPN